MKFAVFFSFTIAATAGAVATPTSGVWARHIDATPEALLIGGSLLMIAALLRHQLAGPMK